MNNNHGERERERERENNNQNSNQLVEWEGKRDYRWKWMWRSLGAAVVNFVVFYLFGGFCAYLRDDEGYKIPGWLFNILLFGGVMGLTTILGISFVVYLVGWILAWDECKKLSVGETEGK